MTVSTSTFQSTPRRWREVEAQLGIAVPRSLRSDTSALLFLEGVAATPMLDKEEELDCLIRYQRDGDLAARETLVRAYLRYVVSTALRHLRKGMPFLDLIQEGTIGLFTAIDKFDVERGVRLYHYSHWWISQAITRAINDKGALIRIPVHMHEQIRQYQKQVLQLAHLLSRTPDRQEIAALLELPLEKVEAIEFALMLKMESIDDEPDSDSLWAEHEDEYLSYAEIVDDPETSLDDWIEKVDLRSQMHAALERLSPRAQEIIAMRYGLYNDQVYTLEEVGKMFGLTRERIRQIEATTIDRLRKQKGSRVLKDYLT
ncbi:MULTISPECIES: sigma-70 family RNA polymerase sigma factor [Brevibacillus]|jgi:RNA polymerase primary sigma factor|uniref:sigma-70 family RNA polymerase sigma factor n=1 Tax=Brevibacillus TaxID=55080 RepID=UPI0004F32322|nr:sigma-70 family RNA polymerase sigma factor [Brevibacillus borstelensis]KKX52847.1 RNA polymerase sigma factor [Brevibacillus borstelensis cifa_chp40]MBE5394126.1 sigma-70 family RNA polymerase sigma factor [Brevibacillus borstelensis]MCC0566057.1 sigma-70 family RNA polymerase sigma factor [Brevibacillus borstelensis]MCM3472735.1 sigma-70 family RNA polymerase sigma factor [Brevibacillus borstelensis]MCM3560857.1 sigma-70 family RNA polymerase sigma factor [Brevibacillus borstelensis]